MVWAYVMENGDGVEIHSNQPIFQLIQKIKLTDEQLVFEQTEDRVEVCKLLESLSIGDKLIINANSVICGIVYQHGFGIGIFLYCLFQILYAHSERDAEPFINGWVHIHRYCAV